MNEVLHSPTTYETPLATQESVWQPERPSLTRKVIFAPKENNFAVAKNQVRPPERPEQKPAKSPEPTPENITEQAASKKEVRDYSLKNLNQQFADEQRLAALRSRQLELPHEEEDEEEREIGQTPEAGLKQEKQEVEPTRKSEREQAPETEAKRPELKPEQLAVGQTTRLLEASPTPAARHEDKEKAEKIERELTLGKRSLTEQIQDEEETAPDQLAEAQPSPTRKPEATLDAQPKDETAALPETHPEAKEGQAVEQSRKTELPPQPEQDAQAETPSQPESQRQPELRGRQEQREEPEEHPEETAPKQPLTPEKTIELEQYRWRASGTHYSTERPTNHNFMQQKLLEGLHAALSASLGKS
jgi:hypothetical protein